MVGTAGKSFVSLLQSSSVYYLALYGVATVCLACGVRLWGLLLALKQPPYTQRYASGQSTLLSKAWYIISSMPKWSLGLIVVGAFALYWAIRSYVIIRKRYRLLRKEKEIRDKWERVRRDISVKHSDRFFELNEKYIKRMKEIGRSKTKLNTSFDSGEGKLSSLVDKFYGDGSSGNDEQP